MSSLDPDQYVEENTDQLAYVIKHSNDQFVRALCIAALVEYGEDGDANRIKKEIEQFQSGKDSYGR